MIYVKKKPGILKSFMKEEKGAHAVMTAMMLFPMIAMAMLAVDYSNAERVKTEMDTATEAVALHTAKRVALDPNLDPGELASESRSMLRAMTPDLDVQFDEFDVDMQTGKVKISAYTNVGTYFASASNMLAPLRGSDSQVPTSLTIRAKNEARFGRRNIEVAIAIDNSGSMGNPADSSSSETKIESAKSAVRELIASASTAVDDLSNADLRFSLTPWSTVVRVDPGDMGSGGQNAWWIDWDGASSTHFRYLPPYAANGDLFGLHPKRSNNWENAAADDDEMAFYDPNKVSDLFGAGNIDDGINPTVVTASGGNIVTRRDVFTNTSTQWAGCFEHRAGEYRSKFDPPSSGVGDSLYVPYMEPDETDDDFGASYSSYRNDYVTDYLGESDYSWTWQGGQRVSTNNHDRMQFFWRDYQPTWGINDNLDGGAARYQYKDIIRARLMNSPKYVGPHMERRNVGQFHPWGYPYGPNGKCYDQPTLLPLTDDMDDIDDAIDAMNPDGNTDASIGMSWAMNTLTPWEPLAGAGEFGETQKVMVFVSDGDNHTTLPNDYLVSYSSLGYFLDDPMDLGWSYDNATADELALDALDGITMDMCQGIKDRGVRIYFVYFGTPSPRAEILKNTCASSPDTAISAANGDELRDAFRQIGDDIGKLRLVHYSGDD